MLGGCPGGGVGNYATEWYKDAASQSSATAVTVSSGMTTGSIDATMAPGPTATSARVDRLGLRHLHQLLWYGDCDQ